MPHKSNFLYSWASCFLFRLEIFSFSDQYLASSACTSRSRELITLLLRPKKWIKANLLSCCITKTYFSTLIPSIWSSTMRISESYSLRLSAMNILIILDRAIALLKSDNSLKNILNWYNEFCLLLIILLKYADTNSLNS